MRQGASAYADGRRSGGSGPPLTPRSVNVGVTPGGRSLGVTGGAARPMAGCGGPSAGVSLELRIGRAGAAGVTVNAAVRCGVVNDLDETGAASSAVNGAARGRVDYVGASRPRDASPAAVPAPKRRRRVHFAAEIVTDELTIEIEDEYESHPDALPPPTSPSLTLNPLFSPSPRYEPTEEELAAERAEALVRAARAPALTRPPRPVFLADRPNTPVYLTGGEHHRIPPPHSSLRSSSSTASVHVTPPRFSLGNLERGARLAASSRRPSCAHGSHAAHGDDVPLPVSSTAGVLGGAAHGSAEIGRSVHSSAHSSIAHGSSHSSSHSCNHSSAHAMASPMALASSTSIGALGGLPSLSDKMRSRLPSGTRPLSGSAGLRLQALMRQRAAQNAGALSGASSASPEPNALL